MTSEKNHIGQKFDSFLKSEGIEIKEEVIMNKLAKDILDKKAYICCPRACGKRTFFKKLSVAILEEQARRLQQSEVEDV